MKTALSLPDSLFRRADAIAAELGVPRSRLYAMALEEFIRQLEHNGVTARLNAVYRDLPPRQAPAALDAGLESLRELTRNDSW